jgi:hypothetical protein
MAATSESWKRGACTPSSLVTKPQRTGPLSQTTSHMLASALEIDAPERATIESNRMFDEIHCWPSSRWPAGTKNSTGRSITTAWPPAMPGTRTKLTVR